MPSILVETGFISNPQEARRLSPREHQTKLAKAIADGIDQFMRANPPPGAAIAAQRQELRHTIARGDTLSEIAARYGVTANALSGVMLFAVIKFALDKPCLFPEILIC